MSARILDGQALAERMQQEIRPEVAAFTAKYGRPPALGILLVGVGLAGAASAFNLPASLAFPLILIAVGVMLLRRK